MVAAQFLKTRVSLEEKERVHALANQLLITESVWLKRLVMRALGESAALLPDSTAGQKHTERQSRDARLYVRLRPEDRLLLFERAAARGMRPATYGSVLVRAHLRSLTPLPKEELMALKRSIAELGAFGRNLNQIARALNQGATAALPGRDDVATMLRIAEALRDHFKAVLKANELSWTGHRGP